MPKILLRKGKRGHEDTEVKDIKNCYEIEKEALKELYLNQLKTQKEIADIYGCKKHTIQRQLSRLHIYKRPDHHKIKEKAKRQNSSLFQKHLEQIKKEDDKNFLNHKKACKLTSCDFGIERLKELCIRRDLDFMILSEVYRKLEKILFKLNLYPHFRTKIALSIYLKFKVSQKHASRLSDCCEASVMNLHKQINPYLRVSKKLPFTPNKTINISKLFEKPEKYLVEAICPNCEFKYEAILIKDFTLLLSPPKCPSCNHKNSISYYEYNLLKEERRCE